MRATLISVIAFSMILSSTTLAADETKDEIKFDQNIITVDIEPNQHVNETSHYASFGYMGLGFATVYALASYKLGFVQKINGALWNLIRLRSLRS